MTAFYGSCPVVGVYQQADDPEYTVLIETPGMYIEWKTPWPPEEGEHMFVSIRKP